MIKEFTLFCLPNDTVIAALLAVLSRHDCNNPSYGASLSGDQLFVVVDIKPEELVMMELHGGFTNLVIAEYNKRYEEKKAKVVCEKFSAAALILLVVWTAHRVHPNE